MSSTFTGHKGSDERFSVSSMQENSIYVKRVQNSQPKCMYGVARQYGRALVQIVVAPSRPIERQRVGGPRCCLNKRQSTIRPNTSAQNQSAKQMAASGWQRISNGPRIPLRSGPKQPGK